MDLATLLRKGSLADVLGGQELLLDAIRDLVRDEIKRKVRETLDQDPELADSVRRAVNRYVEAKVMEGMAVLALAKAGAKLSVEALPPELRDRVKQDVADSLERELHAAFSQL